MHFPKWQTGSKDGLRGGPRVIPNYLNDDIQETSHLKNKQTNWWFSKILPENNF